MHILWLFWKSAVKTKYFFWYISQKVLKLIDVSPVCEDGQLVEAHKVILVGAAAYSAAYSAADSGAYSAAYSGAYSAARKPSSLHLDTQGSGVSCTLDGVLKNHELVSSAIIDVV